MFYGFTFVGLTDVEYFRRVRFQRLLLMRLLSVLITDPFAPGYFLLSTNL
jgi:hypothetical protein